MLIRLTLVLAVALSGCDFLTDDPPPTKAVMTRVVFESAPLLKPDGGRWDGGLNPSGPDLYLVFNDDAGDTRYTTRGATDDSVVRNADESSFPGEFFPENTLFGGLAVDDLSQRYTVELRDADFGGSELMAELGSFTLDATRPEVAGVTTSTSLRSADGTASVRVFWRWEA